MSRLIDAEKLKIPNDAPYKASVKRVIEQQPTVDPVVHGRWIGYHEADFGWDEYGVRCSNCEFEVEDRDVKFSMNYCPNCGAKMDLKED